MKTAVLFGARQSFGFELCSRLLDKGYDVYAIDHHNWITEEQEEKWLLIGRNANLRYLELENDEKAIYPLLSGETCLFIIPAIDYLIRNDEITRNQLFTQLKRFTGQKKESFLVIYPPATERAQSSFAERLDEVIESLRNNHHVMEFCLSDPAAEEKNDMVLIAGSNEEKRKNKAGIMKTFHDDFLSIAVKEAINHIERRKLLEDDS